MANHRQIEISPSQGNYIYTPTKEDTKKLFNGYIAFLRLLGSSPFFIPPPKPDDDRIFPLFEEIFERVIIELKSKGYKNVDLLKIIENIEYIEIKGERKSGKEVKQELVEYVLSNLWDENNPYVQRKFGLALAPFITQDRKYLVINLFLQLYFDEKKKQLLIEDPVWNIEINKVINKIIQKNKSYGKSLPETSKTDPDDLIKTLEILLDVLNKVGILTFEPGLDIVINLIFSAPVLFKILKKLLPWESFPSIPDSPFNDIPYSVFVFWYTDEVYTKRLLNDLQTVMDDLTKNNLNEKIVKKIINLWHRHEPSIANVKIYEDNQLSFLNYELTESQKLAYRRILGQDITSIEGPPGTGKTHLIATYCMDMLIQNKKVLVTSTNNKAVDNVLEKLKQFDISIKDMLITGKYLPGYIRISSGYAPSKDELSQALESFLSETYPEEEIKYNIDVLTKEISMLKDILTIPNELEDKKEELKKITDYILRTKREIASLIEELFISEEKANNFSIDNFLTFSELFERLNKFHVFLLSLFCSHFKHSFISPFISYALEKGIKISGKEDSKYISCKSLYKRNLNLYEKLKNFIDFKESLGELENQESQISFKIKELEKKINKLCSELKLPENGYLNEAKKRLIVRTKELNYWKLQADKGFRKKLENGIERIKEGELWSYTKEILQFSPIIIVTALSSPKVSPPKEDIFDTAIVDEGSQTYFVYTLPAYLRSKKFVVIGDKHQIGPVRSEYIIKEERLIEYFSQLPPHLNYLKSAIETLEYIDNTPDAERRLKEHFRCQKDIIRFCDQLCNYGLDIKTPNRHYDVSVEAPDWVKELFESSLVFINIEGVEQKSGDGKSKKNEKEAEFIINLIEKLSPFVKLSDIGIITPYKAQSRLITKRLRKVINNPEQPVVGTVHVLQGDEREIIIMSLVCTNPESLKQKKLFLNNKNLINVAVSRAKQHLILVGNKTLFEEADNEESPIVKLYKHIKVTGKIFEKWEII